MIITVKIDNPDNKRVKTYRYNTDNGRPADYYSNSLDAIVGGKVIAEKSDRELLDGLSAAVVESMYPLPRFRWSRAVATAWLTEMLRRGLLEFDQHERVPTISFGWGENEAEH